MEELKILSDKEVIEKIEKEHNKYNEQYGNDLNNIKDFKVVGSQLNKDFHRFETTHIDGTQVEVFGIEHRYYVTVDCFDYVLIQKKYKNTIWKYGKVYFEISSI